MALYEFNILDDNEKYQAVWDLGTCLDTIFSEEHWVSLYAIDMFFVDIYYNPNSNKIVKIQSFKRGNPLDKYIDKIPFNF